MWYANVNANNNWRHHTDNIGRAELSCLRPSEFGPSIQVACCGIAAACWAEAWRDVPAMMFQQSGVLLCRSLQRVPLIRHPTFSNWTSLNLGQSCLWHLLKQKQASLMSSLTGTHSKPQENDEENDSKSKARPSLKTTSTRRETQSRQNAKISSTLGAHGLHSRYGISWAFWNSYWGRHQGNVMSPWKFRWGRRQDNGTHSLSFLRRQLEIIVLSLDLEINPDHKGLLYWTAELRLINQLLFK